METISKKIFIKSNSNIITQQSGKIINLGNITPIVDDYKNKGTENINLFAKKSVTIQEKKESVQALEDGQMFIFSLKSQFYESINGVSIE